MDSMGKNTMTNVKPKNTKKVSPIAGLIRVGREKSYVTLHDILQFFPNPEQDIEQLDHIFAILLAIGIPYGDGLRGFKGNSSN